MKLIDISNLPIVWKVHPLKDNWVRTTAVILFLISIVTLVKIRFQGLIYTFIAVFILIGALLKFFMPTQYSMDEDGIQIKHMGRTRYRKWSEFQSFYKSKNNIQLSTFPNPNWLDSFKGELVLLGEDSEEIISFMRMRINEVW